MTLQIMKFLPQNNKNKSLKSGKVV